MHHRVGRLAGDGADFGERLGLDVGDLGLGGGELGGQRRLDFGTLGFALAAREASRAPSAMFEALARASASAFS